MENKKILNYFFIVALITFFIVSLDGLYEFIYGHNIFNNKAFPGRIAGLFGDEWVIGSFLSRILPIMICLYLIQQNKYNNYFKLFFIITIILSIVTISLSGERAAFIFLIISILLYLVLFLKNYFLQYKIFSIVLIIFLLVILSSPFMSENSKDRIFNSMNDHTSLDLNKNHYLAYYNSAYEMFLNKPILGHGPKSFRIKCDDFKNYDIGCNMHPHNTYLQLLSETGFLGFIFIFSFFIYISINLLKILFKKNITNYDLCKFSILISIFINIFPFVPSGSFFNNWISVIYFLPLSFYLYLIENKKYMMKQQ